MNVSFGTRLHVYKELVEVVEGFVKMDIQRIFVDQFSQGAFAVVQFEDGLVQIGDGFVHLHHRRFELGIFQGILEGIQIHQYGC